jgi:hypothetical protein
MQQQTSVFRRHAPWFAFLLAASVAFSLGFACAVPIAAFGAVAALTLPRWRALFLAAGVWLANQLVGFACLGYPWTASTFAWGGALCVVAVLATVAGQSVARHLDGRGAVVVSLAAFLGAFIVYEGGLFVVAATLLGGTEAYTPAIVARVLAINAAACVGLLVLHRLAIAGGLVTRRPLACNVSERHA